ncbi:beta-lactamase family protein [Muricauda sp. CAU 1633]|uniref:serine hydrolase domain-containing protein n=1 Tax=Allomuricauda sp. CAU 1633 TaxID=2816036 RepID=UPI001A8FFCC1|nr:serine hydrolase domain-containing protein [Muricauda sp. CAU 1633]MBO0323328.1 beta-lactamase family protein [Muricauda sp. CAU 1633]
MKQIIILTILLLECHFGWTQIDSNPNHTKGQEVSSILKSLVENGCPGASLAILDEDGWWLQSEGLSNIEEQQKIEDTFLHYLQSVAKTYMAVAILKLYEEGKLQLEDPITQYLAPEVSNMVDRADEITIKMLLNHTSGVPEYNFNPEYASTLLQHPETAFEAVDYIKFIDGKKLNFEPGSRYSYRNTNYVLLSLIADGITGDHGTYIEESIFKPLGLQHTYYRISDKKIWKEELSSSYWDRYSDGVLENISHIQKQNVTYMVGDDGIVTTTSEAILFLKGLLEGKLLKQSTMELMMTWVNNQEGKPAYGLGLGHGDVFGHPYYGHSGGGIGAGCELRYFPETNRYMFIAINIGTVTYSPLHMKLEELRNKLFLAMTE